MIGRIRRALRVGDARPPADSAEPAPDRTYAAVLGRDLENYWEQVEELYAPHANSFASYADLLDAWIRDPATELRPVYQLFDPVPAGARAVALRHDIDADPVTALRIARWLARRGVCGSFYLLHTSPYYGDFHGRVFVRTPELKRWVRGLVVAGCEIGLHNDAFGVELQHDCDGADALVQELAWLRANGAMIRGTVAHNSFPLHGAENYEVFAERVLGPSEAFEPRRGQLPIGALRESDLGLTYEGTFAAPRASVDADALVRFIARDDAGIRSEAWMREYLIDNPYCTWGVDYQLWLTGRDQWVLAGRFADEARFEWGIPFGAVRDVVAALPAGSRTLVVVHPAYVRGN